MLGVSSSIRIFIIVAAGAFLASCTGSSSSRVSFADMQETRNALRTGAISPTKRPVRTAERRKTFAEERQEIIERFQQRRAEWLERQRNGGKKAKTEKKNKVAKATPGRSKKTAKSNTKKRKRTAKHQKGNLNALIAKYARAEGVPLKLAHAVVRVESSYRINARGGVGEIGLMQVRLSTARMMGYRGSAKGLYNPAVNLKYGMKYLGKARRLAKGNTCGTILRYNAGHGAKRMNPISRKYCTRVKRILRG